MNRYGGLVMNGDDRELLSAAKAALALGLTPQEFSKMARGSVPPPSELVSGYKMPRYRLEALLVWYRTVTSPRERAGYRLQARLRSHLGPAIQVLEAHVAKELAKKKIDYNVRLDGF